MKTRFEKYEKVSRQFAMYFEQDELTLRLERKAEIHHITKIEDKKADKEALAKTNKLIESLNERLKHLSNL